MYNIALDLTDGDNLCIDLPPDLGNDVNKQVQKREKKDCERQREIKRDFLFFESAYIIDLTDE